MSSGADTGASEPSYLVAKRGLRSWLLTHDHKRIALLYLIGTALALALGGAFALALRVELLAPDHGWVSATTYNRFFTLHGITMVWLFMVPAIPGIFGNFLLPLMIGAHDVAMPRLNLASFWVYVLGATVTLAGMVLGGTDTGWTFYAPYSTSTPTQVVPVLTGIVILGFSSIFTGLNFIVTVHTLRAEGMTWMRMPLFVWAIYGTAVVMVLATPVLGMTLLLVLVEHVFQTGLFDAARGGDPLLFQHLFWFYSHPAVYIMVLPAMGVVSEVVPACAHRPPLGYRAIAASTFGIAFVGFLVWGHHLFVSGQSAVASAIFGFLSMVVGIFTAIKVFSWVGTLYKGAITFNTPLAYVAGFIFLIVFGGMTGVAVATVGLDAHWHDTYFVVAHFHFIMAGSVLLSFLAALHFWFPKMFGRMYSERWGLVGAFLVFMGFAGTFTPQFLLGNMGMPRRYYAYPEQFHSLHVASTIGAFVLGVGMMIALLTLLQALLWGERAPQNPWESAGFEWETPSPPPEHNFAATPVIERDAYDFARAGRLRAS